MRKYLVITLITIIIHLILATLIIIEFNQSKAIIPESYEAQGRLVNRYFEAIGNPKTLEEQMTFEYIIYEDSEKQGTTFSEFKSNYNKQ